MMAHSSESKFFRPQLWWPSGNTLQNLQPNKFIPSMLQVAQTNFPSLIIFIDNYVLVSKFRPTFSVQLLTGMYSESEKNCNPTRFMIQ